MRKEAPCMWSMLHVGRNSDRCKHVRRSPRSTKVNTSWNDLGAAHLFLHLLAARLRLRRNYRGGRTTRQVLTIFISPEMVSSFLGIF